MCAKSLRKMRYSPTGELRKRGTRPLGETGVLGSAHTPDQLLVQVSKLLLENEVLSDRFSAISDLAVAVNSSLRLEDILGVMVSKARYALDFDYCSVGIVIDNKSEYVLQPLVWREGRVPSPGEQQFALSSGLPGSVISRSKPLIVQDLTERPLSVLPSRYSAMLDPALEGRRSPASRSPPTRVSS